MGYYQVEGSALTSRRAASGRKGMSLALFGTSSGRPNRAKALQRVTNRDWSNREEMNEALRDLSHVKDLRAEELMPLLTSSETTVRFFAEKMLRERH